MRDMLMGLLCATALFLFLPNGWTLAFVCMIGFMTLAYSKRNRGGFQ